ncbi:MAG: tetratricopeptide repeat protein [Pseudomonadota bacterium]
MLFAPGFSVAADSPYPFRAGTTWELEHQGVHLQTLVEGISEFRTAEGPLHAAVVRREDGTDRIVFRTDREWFECERAKEKGQIVTCSGAFAFFQWPLDSGSHWTSGGFDFFVVGRENVSTPAGEFKGAWKVSYSPRGSADSLGQVWIAEGVGRVKVREGEREFDLVRFEAGTGPDLAPSDAGIVRKLLENARTPIPGEGSQHRRAARVFSLIRDSRMFPVIVLQVLVLGALVFVGLGIWHALRAQRKLVELATPSGPQEEARFLISLVRGGDPKQAEARLRELVAQHPAYPDLRHHLATILASQGKMEEARDQWNAALAANLDYVDARLGLARLLLAMGRIEEAAGHFRKITAQKPRFADAYLGLAQAALRSGRATQAEEALTKALAVNPGFEEAKALLAECRNFTQSPKLGT